MATLAHLLSAGLAHHQSGAFAQADRCYREILAADPGHADALHLLGVLAQQAGHPEVAIPLIRAAIAGNPNFSGYHNNLGNALQSHGDHLAAEASFRSALRLDPNNADACTNLGALLHHIGRLEEARRHYQEALHLVPASPKANLALSILAAAVSDRLLALQHAEAAVSAAPTLPPAHNALGNAHFELGQMEEADASYHRALLLDPMDADALYNLGNLHRALGDHAAAELYYRQAIALSPAQPDVFNNLALVLSDSGRCDEAIACFRHALELDPAYPEAHWHLGMTLLLAGHYAEGWREYEWRWRCKKFTSPARGFPQPQWKGEPLDSRTILLHAEQGAGDTIQFVRYASLVARRGGRIILEVQPGLRRLLEAVPGIAQCVTQREALPHFDVHCPLMSLPMIFGTTINTVPPPAFAAQPASLIAADERLKVGLVWAGSPKHKADKLRSIPAATLRPLGTVPGLAFFSLQKGPAAAEHLSFCEREPCAAATDFADTAAILQGLDLIISVDTAVAHLAASMGKPTWILLPQSPEWRWGLGSETTPWYPSARLFRATQPGGWPELIDHVAAQLSLFRADFRASLAEAAEATFP